MNKLMTKMLELKKIPGLYEFTMANCFCAGGAVRDIARDREPKDYDIFFKTKEAIDEFKQKFSHLTTETVLGNFNLDDFQFITMYYGSPTKVVAKFDWNVNQVFVNFTEHKPTAWGGVHFNDLTFNCNASYPLSALLRLPRLIEMGFKINAKEFAFVVAFIAAKGCLSSTERCQKELAFVPSADSQMNLNGLPERAQKAALANSPLMTAMKEGQEDSAPDWL